MLFYICHIYFNRKFNSDCLIQYPRNHPAAKNNPSLFDKISRTTHLSNLGLIIKLCQQCKDKRNSIKSSNILVQKLVRIILRVAKMHFQKMILKKKKSYFQEELGKNRNKPKELWNTLKSLGLSSEKQNNQKFLLRKMVLFNLKHWKMQILSKGSTLNQLKASKKNFQGHPTDLQVKQPKLLHQDFMQCIQ